MSQHFDCQRCGACCATFRVSFYWAEADDAGGTVPVHLTLPVGSLHRCMAGTETRPVRCVALDGQVGEHVGCSIYAQRSSTCHSVVPGDAQCLKARAHHGLIDPRLAVINGDFTGSAVAPPHSSGTQV